MEVQTYFSSLLEPDGVDMNPPSSDMTTQVQQFLQEHMPMFEGIVRSYVVRMGLAHGAEISSFTHDVLGEASLEALAHTDRFLLAQQPKAWFLVIATNILKRRRTLLMRQSSHEQSVAALLAEQQDENESDFFDRVTSLSQPGPEQDFVTRERVQEILRLVSPEDRNILQLAILHDLNTHYLAQVLHISTGAARVRLHRALHRLRLAWHEYEENNHELR
jgi:RNA polymerase sigma factor (sigma-70 family)